MILLIDNYDSFTYNLAQYLGELGAPPVVRRNDEMSLDEIEAMQPERIVISPGPGRPEDAGITVDVIGRFGPRMPVLGVCLGHQGIGIAFGGTVVRAGELMHGKVSSVQHDGRGVFRGVSQPFTAGRYHSLVVAEPLPDRSRSRRGPTTARSWACGIARSPVHGVQFHPESVLSRRGPADPAQFPGAVMFSALIEKLQRRQDLTIDEAAAAMDEIMEGRAQPAQIAGLLIAPRDERRAARRDRRPRADDARARDDGCRAFHAPVFDTCGTGGDRAHTFNVSTVAALVLAACGVRVAKHGNRSVSSRCGSADLFEALGVNIAADAARRRALSRRGRDRVLLRADVSSVDAARRADAEGARRADGVQPARPADESRPARRGSSSACRGRS